MKYAVITGASRGLGASAAQQLMSKGINVVSIARNESSSLKQEAVNAGAQYTHYSCDLTSTEQVQTVFNEIAAVVFKNAELVYLINNAGVIEPIETAGELEPSLIGKNVQINLTAPILISNLFLQKAKKAGIPAIIANVTSGAAERPIQGWSIYCSTKAAVNMFTMTAGLELEEAGSISKVIAFSPGIMDTDMQATIRSSSEEAFADVAAFRNYKETGSLRSPDTVAGALVKLIMDSSLENGKIYKVNDL
ncbi:(S)-benzoin forming benzil reductase [Mesobacillus subterraneus]|uniref:(S)-benzoin forming benzil reductase n=1 Tax=Mesobacillus subterraneus TaxID=285983 RepID=A0A3R9EX39_9BACI|nr:(S)-benzoin forming benzil reductase [Mesobacillus subterraneus]RSD25070.1 (S)-benzoin forming benzil reductase [Mesobacillus subterraneus]